MRKIYVFVLAFFSALPLFAQNTTIELNSLTGNNIFCRSGADTVVLSITGSNIPAGSDVILYSSTDSTFNPYLGQGDSIGYFKGDSIQSDLLPSRSCVDIIGIFIDACNPSPIPEYHNEYIFLYVYRPFIYNTSQWKIYPLIRSSSNSTSTTFRKFIKRWRLSLPSSPPLRRATSSVTATKPVLKQRVSTATMSLPGFTREYTSSPSPSATGI